MIPVPDLSDCVASVSSVIAHHDHSVVAFVSLLSTLLGDGSLYQEDITEHQKLRRQRVLGGIVYLCSLKQKEKYPSSS